MPNPKDPIKLQEYREKQRIISRERYKNPVYKEKWKKARKKGITEETRRKLSIAAREFGNRPEEKKRRSDRAIQKGYGKWMKGRKDTPFLLAHKKLAKWRKGKTYKEIYGDRAEIEAAKRKQGNINHWKDIQKIYEQRPYHGGSAQYEWWRKAVFKRDNWACQHCGASQYVEAHHIKSWKNFPEFRYEVSNGITLCKKCHKMKNTEQRIQERTYAFKKAGIKDPLLQ